ncbi:MAG: Thrombospondin type 3 repeat [Frankiales bacterium]|nr:Thrombospondin type 3 repeat [Frankiales bacterium]
MRPPRPLRRVLLLAAAVTLGAAVPAFAGSAPPPPAPFTGAAAGYAGTHFGDGDVPAGCILDRDEADPDNGCFHMKVGLNALDSPEVNVAVLVPVSPAAERDMRIMRQAVDMWSGGIQQLAKQMDLDWLAKGVHFNVTTRLVPTDANGLPTQAIHLVKPKIVVVATNPVGGIGIGIDPVNFASQLGITGADGLPCGSIADPFSMKTWQQRPGFDDHHGDQGGIYVKRCDGPGGQVCFSVNGAVDPVPGKTDFFSLYDLVAHETGHCLTLGHVGDGADGPWGPTPTDDIMAYSSDPVDVAKCVSTLDVEGFALRMSRFLDVDGNGKVDDADVLVPNDLKGDGASSFQVQNPHDHSYASGTGRAEDCPQPDTSTLPLAEQTDWQPTPVATTRAALTLGAVTGSAGRLSWGATAAHVDTRPVPTERTTSVSDPTGDGAAPATDLTRFTASVTPTDVRATLTLDRLWPTTDGGRATGYGLYVGGRKFDSFVPTQGTSSEVQTIDSGGRYLMPAGTSTWDTEKGTVTFTIPRSYLAKQRIQAPYSVFAATGVHIRTKDWVTSLDRAPDSGYVKLAGPPAAPGPKDAPMAKKRSTRTVALTHEGGNTFTPADTSTQGVPLVPVVGNVHQFALPIKEQATAEVTLTWDDPSSALGLLVKGGSGQESESGDGSVTVTVPWAHRDLAVQVVPSQVGAPSVDYTLTAKLTSLTANADGDAVPDIADVCKKAAGPASSGGCPDTDRDGVLDTKDTCAKIAGRQASGCPTAADEKVVAFLDGKQVSSTYAMTRHGRYDTSGSVAAKRGTHTLKLVWYSGSTVVKTVSSQVTVR